MDSILLAFAKPGSATFQAFMQISGCAQLPHRVLFRAILIEFPESGNHVATPDGKAHANLIAVST
jgi:hypothetical protein